MCVGFWTLEHPDYALILCSNRDEFLSRPTTPAHWHAFEMPPSTEPTESSSSSSTDVLSGRDLRGGGTWLGISRSGRVALLTNITEQAARYASTRGELLSSFLHPPPSHHAGEGDGEGLNAHVEHVKREGTVYAGFNLLLLAPSFSPPSSSSSSSSASPQASTSTPAQPPRRLAYTAAYLTNHAGGGRVASRPLTDAERRRGGLSNGVDGQGAEAWPKVRGGVARFAEVVAVAGGGEVGEEVEGGADAAAAAAATTTTRTAPPGRGLADVDEDPDATEMKLVERLFGILTWRSPAPPRTRADLRDTIQIEPLRVRVGLPPSSESSLPLGPEGGGGRSDDDDDQRAQHLEQEQERREDRQGQGQEQGEDGSLYGTRLSTVVLVARDGRVLFVERDIWQLDQAGGGARKVDADADQHQRVFRFQLDLGPGEGAEPWRGNSRPEDGR